MLSDEGQRSRVKFWDEATRNGRCQEAEHTINTARGDMVGSCLLLSLKSTVFPPHVHSPLS